MIKLYNTLSRKKEPFLATGGKPVSFYACGPTVYDYAHIGNLRTYIFEDLLFRTLKYFDFDLKSVMNITDIDDKIIAKSAGNKEKQQEITKKFEVAFFADLTKLNIEKATKITRATEYINKMVELIKKLIDKGFAYKADDGSIYFSINKFKDYGKLAGINQSDLQVGARVKQDEYEKENPADFVLWKAWDEKDGDIFWQTDLGKGRPGWHIECSAMANAELGETIDIHAGGVDLIFPHHENEIAQSEAVSGKPFALFFVHGEHLLVDGKKMSKSLNNFYTLSDLAKRGFSPLDFRYFVLLGHYRSKLNFTFDGLTAAKNGLQNLRQNIARLKDSRNVDDNIIKSARVDFEKAISDDLNTPAALSVLQNLIGEFLTKNQNSYGSRPEAENSSLHSKNKKNDFLSLISDFDQVLGLDLIGDAEIPASIIALAKKRLTAKKSGDYASADKIRTDIECKGYLIEDLENNKYHLITK